jgi:hypothetical protein
MGISKGPVRDLRQRASSGLPEQSNDRGVIGQEATNKSCRVAGAVKGLRKKTITTARPARSNASIAQGFPRAVSPDGMATAATPSP